MKRIAILLLLALPLAAQGAHKITLTWQEAGNADVYRSASSCDAAVAFTKIAVNVPSGYVDAAVTGGATYCYYVIEQPSNVPSNLLEVDIPADAIVAIKAAKQTAGAVAQ